MKKLLEGASLFSVFLLLLTATTAFIFNVQNQKASSRKRKKYEKLINKQENNKKNSHEKIREIQKEKDKMKGELEYLRKMNDPIWNYYDIETNRTKVLPGRYGVDTPPKTPYD